MVLLMETVPREEETDRDLLIMVLDERTKILSPEDNQEETIKDPLVVILPEEDRTMELSKTTETQREIRVKENGNSTIKSAWEQCLNGMAIQRL